MGKAGNIVVTLGGDKYLCLMLETAEGIGVDNTVAVALEGSAYRAGFLVSYPASR